MPKPLKNFFKVLEVFFDVIGFFEVFGVVVQVLVFAASLFHL